MSEHSHYGPLITGANAEGMALYRIHDGGGKNPFDIGGFCKCGLGVAMEVKVIDALPTYIPWHKFETQQITWLRAAMQKGGLAMAAIFYIPIQSMRIIHLRSDADFENKAYPLKTHVMKKENGVYRGVSSVCNCFL